MIEALLAALALCAIMVAAWLHQRATQNGGWADVYWSFGTGAVGAGLALAIGTAGPRRLVVAALAVLWGLRLGSHILARTRRDAEDARYTELRRQWGDAAQWRLFAFFQVQAAAALPLVGTIALASANPAAGLTGADLAGVGVFALALAGATLADRQLAAFRRDPAQRGRICDRGLWAWSRHPNYFFEWLGWVAFPVIAIGTDVWPWGFAALAGPALMYWLLVHVSGIPPLEAHMLASRGDAFHAYSARTRPFLPLPRWSTS
ncbi:MAG TPA: DUF1295 domain-containing protein [Xanthobacteraceae bacterium]|nr:DUF1295 domain-containing protein [Xanthobacteraceae bacterium]